MRLKLKTYNLKPGNRSGFTLIELLVVISITGLLSGLLVLYGSTGRQQTTLSIEAAKMTQLISRAKTLSISTYEDPTSPCGYGLHVDYAARTYSLTSYKVAPSCVSVSSSSQSISIQSTATQNTFTLPAGISFNSDPSLSDKIDDVFFVPPDPKTVINIGGSLLRDTTGYIYLITNDGSLSRRVSVNASGQITY